MNLRDSDNVVSVARVVSKKEEVLGEAAASGEDGSKEENGEADINGEDSNKEESAEK